MASAIQALSLLIDPPHPQQLVASAGKALAPTLVGMLLASMAFIARFLPVEPEESHTRQNQVILKAWGNARKQFIHAVSLKLSALYKGTLGDIKNLTDPWRFIPLLIFAAAWPAVGKLDGGLWVIFPT